jgi:transcriptional regulator with XRE-family HTH domain
MVSKLESGDYNYTIEQLWKVSQKLGFIFEIKFEEEVDEDVTIMDDKDDYAYQISSLMAVGS